MALKALDVYKLLPKKNCKECGDPTCLTFAMKLPAEKRMWISARILTNRQSLCWVQPRGPPYSW